MISSKWPSTSRPHKGALGAKALTTLLKAVEVIPDVLYVPDLTPVARTRHVMQDPNVFCAMNHMSVFG